MKESGPDEMPLVDLTLSFFGRICENENPVPPPLLWMSAVFLTEVENFLHGIAHRQHEAGGELLQFPPGVHERGRVGKEIEVGHEIIEFFGPDVGVRVGD